MLAFLNNNKIINNDDDGNDSSGYSYDTYYVPGISSKSFSSFTPHNNHLTDEELEAQRGYGFSHLSIGAEPRFTPQPSAAESTLLATIRPINPSQSLNCIPIYSFIYSRRIYTTIRIMLTIKRQYLDTEIRKPRLHGA